MRKTRLASLPEAELADSKPVSRSHVDVGRQVISMEAEALTGLAASIDVSFTRAVDLILGCRQRVIVSGIGKSAHVARKVAATLAATGTPALFIHAAEAAHGDAGMVSPGDVLTVFRWSRRPRRCPMC